MDPTYSRTVLPWISGLFSWMAALLLIPSFAGGLGLLRAKDWGRVLIILVSLELLFIVPVGTALGAFGLWVLLRQSAASGPPRQLTSNTQRPRSSGLLLAMTSVAAGFLILLGAGFLLFGGAQGFGISPVRMVGGGVMLAVGVLAAQVRRHTREGSKARSAPNPGAEAATQFTPVQQPPFQAHPAPCEHLKPIDTAMRAAGISVRPIAGSGLRASCRIHVPSFEHRFGQQNTISYAEYFQPERHFEDNPTARLICTHCGSILYTLHAFESTPGTQWFPAGPPSLTLLAAPDPAAKAEITAIAVSPTGRLAAVAHGSAHQQSELVVWDTQDRQPLRRFVLPAVMRTLVWSPDERSLITGRGTIWEGGSGTRGATIFVFDVASGAEVHRFADNLFAARGMALSSDSTRLVIAAMLGETQADGSSLDLWDLSSGRAVESIARVEGAASDRLPYFTGVAFSADGGLIIASCGRYYVPARSQKFSKFEPPWWWNRGVRTWSTSGRQELDIVRHHEPVTSLAVSTHGSRLLLVGDRVGVWNLASGVKVWDQRGCGENAAAASFDGGMVARGFGLREDNHGPYRDTLVELYNGGTGEIVSTGQHRTSVTALAFLPGQKGALLAGGEEGELRFWSVEQNTPDQDFSSSIKWS
jgi:WD40 repeat protein